MREFKKKIVVILSKIDLLESEKDLADVMAWVRNALSLSFASNRPPAGQRAKREAPCS